MDKFKLCNRCPIRGVNKTCNNLIDGNLCVAVEHPHFVDKCPFYRAKSDTPAEEMKYHKAHLPEVEGSMD